MNLFIYGTLLERSVLSFALGRYYDGSYESAILKDYIKLQPGFFMIFPHEGGEVKGKVIRHLSGIDFMGLDSYEGVATGLYERKMVQVTVTDGGNVFRLYAFTYCNGRRFNKEDYMKPTVGLL